MGRVPSTPWYPRLIQVRRFARNHHVPEAGFITRCYQAYNHAGTFRRKVFLRWSFTIPPLTIGAAGTTTPLRFRCRTGEDASQIRWLLGYHQTSGAGTAPQILLDVTPAGGATTTVTIELPLTSPLSGPGGLAWREYGFDVDPDTEYECAVRLVDRALIYAACAYERTLGANLLDSPTGSTVPVTDSERGALLGAASDAWRHNGSHLLTWPGSFVGTGSSTSTFNTTTFTNVIDGSTSVTSNSAGFYLGDSGNSLPLTPWTRYSDGDTLDVVFCVHASTSTGSVGEVRLRDGSSTLCSITGIGTTAQWYTSTTTISSMGSRAKADLQARVSTLTGSPVLTVNAVSLYAYLA